MVKEGKMIKDGYGHAEFRTVVLKPRSLWIIFRGS